MAKTKEKELIVLNLNNYPMLTESAADVLEAMKSNFEGEDVKKRDVFKEIPNSKGDDYWTIQTPDGKQTYEELTGVILYIGNERALFEGEYGTGSNIPRCTSEDGIMAKGEPGGSCRECDLKDFGPNSELPECTQKKPIYALIPEINPVLPVVIYVSSTSFPSLKKFRSFTAQYGIQFWDLEIKFSLTTAKTKNNKDASILNFEVVNNIKKTNPEAYQKILAFRKTFLPFMAPASVAPPEEAMGKA
jgi:hypothetical protein